MQAVTESMDYSQLQSLLAASDWQAADEVTKVIILKVTGREAEGFIRAKDIDLLPVGVLDTINKLWLEASNGKFGLSVQKGIWLSVEQNYTDFGDRVGWYRNGSWLDKSEVNFSSAANVGHLPALLFPTNLAGNGQVFSFVVGKWRTVLLSRKDL